MLGSSCCQVNVRKSANGINTNGISWKAASRTGSFRLFFVCPRARRGLRIPLTRREPCCNRNLEQNSRITNGSARHYLRWANLVTLAPLAIARFAENGSARYTRKTRRGIAARSSRAMKAAKDNVSVRGLPHCQAATHSVPKRIDR